MSIPGITAPYATASVAGRASSNGSATKCAAATQARRDSEDAAWIGTPAAKKTP